MTTKAIIEFGEGPRDVKISFQGVDNVSPRKIGLVEHLLMKAFKAEVGKVNRKRAQAEHDRRMKEDAEREVELQKKRDKESAATVEDNEKSDAERAARTALINPAMAESKSKEKDAA